MALPEFLIFGAPNCASSFLHRNIAEHPEIYMIPSEPVEACFFEDYEYFKYNFEIVRKAFEKVDSQKVLGMKRPTYINRPQSASRIKKHLPEIKLIAVLRNPMERAVTSYFHHMQENFFPLTQIEKGIKMIVNGNWDQNYPRSRDVLDLGLYYKGLSHYIKYFEKDKFHIITLDDIKINPVEIIRKVYKFLGVNQNFMPSSIIRPANKQSGNKFSLFGNYIQREKNKIRMPLSKDKTRVFNKSRREWGVLGLFTYYSIDVLDRVIFSRIVNNKRPELSNQTKQLLFEFYKTDIINLEKFIGRSLHEWKKWAK